MEGIGAKGLKTKLIVNYLPQSMSDQQFHMLFAQIGPVESAKVIREKGTNYSFGYGFVDYIDPQHAMAAIDKLNGHQLEHKVLKVAYSKPPSNSKNVNLYVSGLAAHVTEENLLMLFSNHGDVITTKVLREEDGSSKGTGFVLFKTKAEADAGIRALQGYVDGYGSNFQIKYAKDSTEQQRSHPKYKEYLHSKFSQGTQQHSNYQQQDSFASTVTYGYNVVPVAAAYGGGYSTIPYGSSDVAQKAARGRGGGVTRYNPLARPLNGGIGMVISPNATLVDPNPTVLFVYNIGPNATEGDMYSLFAKYGRIAKVDVVEGRGFAFVHMPIAYEAHEAVRCLNGLNYHGKLLQVSVKTK